jgi:hypothetical protein
VSPTMRSAQTATLTRPDFAMDSNVQIQLLINQIIYC